jgi:hypothetical protein
MSIDNDSPAPAPAEPVVESVGEDQLDLWRRGVRAMEAQIEEQRIPLAEAKEKKALAELCGHRDTLYFVVKRTGFQWLAECIAGLPTEDSNQFGGGSMRDVRGLADTPENAVHEARFGYAQALFKSQLCETMEAARERAAKAELITTDVFR